MREIKFRAQETNSTNWVYGHYYTDQRFINGESCVDVHIIRDENHQDFEVKGETIGQFTDLFDKNKKEMYEGDKVNILNPTTKEEPDKCVIRFNQSIAAFEGFIDGSYSRFLQNHDVEKNLKYDILKSGRTIEVIGNIHTP